MKLFRIYQTQNGGYDTYDSAVVAAPDAETARNMHPNGDNTIGGGDWNNWAAHPEAVRVKLIGEAVDGMPQGVICASYNAG